MVWYLALLGIAVPIIVILVRKYYAEKKAEEMKEAESFSKTIKNILDWFRRK